MIRIKRESPSFHGFEESVLEAMRPGAQELVEQGAEIILEEWDRMLSRKGPPVEGAAPAEVKGELRRSLTKTAPTWRGKNRVYADVGIPGESAGGEFAARLEFGGTDKDGNYLPPHPHKRPARAKALKRILALAEESSG